jgi:hypothetical protein
MMDFIKGWQRLKQKESKCPSEEIAILKIQSLSFLVLQIIVLTVYPVCISSGANCRTNQPSEAAGCIVEKAAILNA